MAESRWRWTRWEWDALKFFRDVAVDRAGYQLRGVRGWAHINDVQEELSGSGFAEVLPRLTARGLLDHADVRAPSMVRPTWIYRITERGVQVADAHAPANHAPIPPPRRVVAEPAVYAPDRQRGGLLLLRSAYDDPTVPVRFDGRGWLSGRELGQRVEASNYKRKRGARWLGVDTTDLRWLAQWQFAERRDDSDVIYWRVTELGRTVKLLTWAPRRTVRV
jgi:hypothetical protein